MEKRNRSKIVSLAVAWPVAMICSISQTGFAHTAIEPARQDQTRHLETLDRGLIAIPHGADVFLSWRLLHGEPMDLPFDLYRSDGKSEIKLNDQPLIHGTNFVDRAPPRDVELTYRVQAVGAKASNDVDRPFKLPAGRDVPYLEIPIQDLPEGYLPNDATVADLDGDGRPDIVVHLAKEMRDNSHTGLTSPALFDAYTLDGKRLWRINLGQNIRNGAHYTPFVVYDFDSDGFAEFIIRTSDGFTDGEGKVHGDPSVDHRNPDGRITRGNEWLTLFDGRTGRALDTVDYVPARHPTNPINPTGDELKAVWGDGYGNRSERYLAGVASLDGKNHSAIMCRGYYTRTAIAAWDVVDGKLKLRWHFDSSSDPSLRPYAGQGNHSLSVADVDGDGRDEIIYGAMVLNSDGTGRFTTKLGHGDAMHVGDLDPDRPGLEVGRIQERFDDAGLHMFDASTGEILWKVASVKAAESGGDRGEGPGRGVSFDIDPRFPGAESWVRGAGISGIYDAKGNRVIEANPACNFAVWWDGDDLRELLDGTVVSKWNWNSQTINRLFDASDFGVMKINGTKSNPSLSGDILGDWREEIIYPTNDGKALRIFSTNIPTDRRLHSLLLDPQYRIALAWQNAGYNQPPHPSFAIDQRLPGRPPQP